MTNPNETEGYNDSLSTENNNNENFEYNLSFPQNLVNRIEVFIERFHISYETLINKLLFYHFNDLKNEIESADYNLLAHYYFCLDEIFSDSENKICDSLKEDEIKIKKIPVKISQEYHTVVKKISDEIHYEPEVFIRKAIQCQWDAIGANLEAGYYDIIEDFCNISEIKKNLEELFEKKRE